MKNLVMGVAKGYSWDILEPFVISCKKNCPSAELVLFVDDISDFTCARLQSAGVLLGSYPENLKRGVPNNTRWKVFADFLKIHGDAYEQIFITDTRDVIFQGDVFEPFKTFKNYLGLATEADVIGGDKAGNENYSWLVDCFGKDEADRLLNQKIICDGTIIGTTAEMKIFAEKIWQAVSAAESRTNLRIHDQAVANYLVYNNLLPIENLIEIDVEHGEIFTMALLKRFPIRGELILRLDCGVPAVVHQYDRHKELIKFFDDIYHDKNFQADERFNDTRSAIEQIFYLLYVNKIDDAARFCMKNFSAELNRGKNVDYLLKCWGLASKKPLTPTVGFIELTMQTSLKFTEDFYLEQFDKICSLLSNSVKNNRGVEPEFKTFLVNLILKFIKRAMEIGNAELCFHFIEEMKSFELTPDKDFYLLEAKANQIFGRKEENFAAYKKSLG